MPLVQSMTRGEPSCAVLRRAMKLASAAFLELLDGYTLGDLIEPRAKLRALLTISQSQPQRQLPMRAEVRSRNASIDDGSSCPAKSCFRCAHSTLQLGLPFFLFNKNAGPDLAQGNSVATTSRGAPATSVLRCTSTEAASRTTITKIRIAQEGTDEQNSRRGVDCPARGQARCFSQVHDGRKCTILAKRTVPEKCPSENPPR